MSEITITGNLVSAPNVSYTGQGIPVANFRIARTERYRDGDGGWKDGETLFITCVCWRDLAESVANLNKGERVIVVGKLRNRTWNDERFTNSESEMCQRIVTEIQADDVLRSAKVKKLEATA